MKCAECQNEIPQGSVFCPICGSAVFEEAVAVIPEPEPEAVIPEPIAEETPEPTPEAQKKLSVKMLFGKKLRKWWILAAACLLVVTVVIVAAQRPDVALYSTADGLFFVDLSGGRPVMLMENGICANAVMTENQKHLFYKAEANTDRVNDLYHLDLRSLSRKPEKLAEDVGQFYANPKGTRVAYIRNGNLYVHDLTSEKLIAKNTYRFLCDEDCDTFVYGVLANSQDMDIASMVSTWYLRDGNAQPKLIGKGVSVLRFTADGKTLIYRQNDRIVAWKNGEEILIGKNASLIGGVYDDLSFYYKTQDEKGHDIYCFYDGEKSVDIPAGQIVQAGNGQQPTLSWQDESTGKNYVAVREKVVEIPQGEVKGTNVSEDGKTLSVVIEGKNVRLRDLYTVDVARGETQLLMQDAEAVVTQFVGEKLYYVASAEGMPSTLYCDGKEILPSVRLGISEHQGTGTVLVRGEMLPDNQSAAYLVRSGKVIKLTDKGRGETFSANGDVLLCMNGNGETTELWRFDRSGRGSLLVEDVTGAYSVGKSCRPSSTISWNFDLFDDNW